MVCDLFVQLHCYVTLFSYVTSVHSNIPIQCGVWSVCSDPLLRHTIFICDVRTLQHSHPMWCVICLFRSIVTSHYFHMWRPYTPTFPSNVVYDLFVQIHCYVTLFSYVTPVHSNIPIQCGVWSVCSDPLLHHTVFTCEVRTLQHVSKHGA